MNSIIIIECEEEYYRHYYRIVYRRGIHSVVIVRLTYYDTYEVLVLEEGHMLLVESQHD